MLKNISKIRIIIAFIILLWCVHYISVKIVLQRERPTYMVLALSVLMMLPYIIRKIGLFPIFCGLIFLFWLPLDSRLFTITPYLSWVYPAELGMWLLCIGIFVFSSVQKGNQVKITKEHRLYLLPFLLIIGNGIIQYLFLQNYEPIEIARFRILCILPGIICFLCLYMIKTVKQAEKVLWIFLISAGLLGLIYIFLPHTIGGLDTEIVHAGGRIRRIIKLPLWGALHMPPETTAVCFAFIVAMSFVFWLNHSYFWGRFIAACVFFISCGVLLCAQGRMGVIGSICAIAAVILVQLRFKIGTSALFKGLLLKMGIGITFLLGSFWYYASIATVDIYQRRIFTLIADPLHAEGLEERMFRWRSGIEIAFNNFFGGGIYSGYEGMESWFVHNLYLFLKLSFGLIGFVGFIWLYTVHIKRYWRAVHSSNHDIQMLTLGGLGCAVVLAVSGLGSCIMWDPWQVSIFWIPFGITVAATFLENKDIAFTRHIQLNAEM